MTRHGGWSRKIKRPLSLELPPQPWAASPAYERDASVSANICQLFQHCCPLAVYVRAFPYFLGTVHF